MYTSIANAMAPLEQKYENINQDLERAESTLSLLQGASFPWQESETPIVAVRAKDLNSDLEGIVS